MYIPIQNSTSKETFKNANLKVLNGHKKRVYCLDWNNDGTKLLSGSVDTTLRVNLKNKIKNLKIIRFGI